MTIKRKAIRKHTKRKVITKRRKVTKSKAKKLTTLRSRKTKGKWDAATEKAMKRHEKLEEKRAAKADRESWVAVGNDEYYAEQDRRRHQSERDKSANNYRRSGYDNPGIGY